MSSHEVTLTIGILGYGNVARALCGLIQRQQARLRQRGVALKVAAIAGRTRGVAEHDDGLDLGALSAGGAGVEFRSWRPGEDGVSFAAAAPGGVLVELTTLDVHSGQPAISHIETALCAGKHVVTANKGPVAWDYARLDRLARERGRAFLFEATVMDGVPVFSLYRRCLSGCRVTGLRGVLNSTTNFILDRMGHGLGFEAALGEARAMGVAEADPALDVDGWDPAAKLSILANVLMGARLTPAGVERRGIRDLGPADIRAARGRGRVVKLVCEASGYGAAPSGDLPQVRAVVEPREIEAGSPFAAVSGTSSALTISTDLLGDLTLTEREPRLAQTAYGVLADLLEVARLKREGRG